MPSAKRQPEALDFSTYCDRILPLLGVELEEPRAELDLYDEVGLDSFQALELVLLSEQLAGLYAAVMDIPIILSLGDAYGYYTACFEAKSSDVW